MDNLYGSSSLGMFGAIAGVVWLITLVLCIVIMTAQWKIFKKAGEPGIAAIVPFWNTAVLFKLTWGVWYYMFLTLIPFVGIVISFMTCFKLGKMFGKGTGFNLGLIFLPVIFMPVLAFGSAQYIGFDKAPAGVAKMISYEDEDQTDDGNIPQSSGLADNFDPEEPEEIHGDVRPGGSGRHWSV